MLGGIANLDVTDPWTKLLIGVFIVLTFVPLVFQMNTEIKVEAKGRSWFEYGATPREKKSSEYENYARQFRSKVRRR